MERLYTFLLSTPPPPATIVEWIEDSLLLLSFVKFEFWGMLPGLIWSGPLPPRRDLIRQPQFAINFGQIFIRFNWNCLTLKVCETEQPPSPKVKRRRTEICCSCGQKAVHLSMYPQWWKLCGGSPGCCCPTAGFRSSCLPAPPPAILLRPAPVQTQWRDGAVAEDKHIQPRISWMWILIFQFTWCK